MPLKDVPDPGIFIRNSIYQPLKQALSSLSQVQSTLDVQVAESQGRVAEYTRIILLKDIKHPIDHSSRRKDLITPLRRDIAKDIFSPIDPQIISQITTLLSELLDRSVKDIFVKETVKVLGHAVLLIVATISQDTKVILSKLFAPS